MEECKTEGMGKFYNVKCTHCGYSFKATYGGGRHGDDDTVMLKMKFEEGKAEKGLQGIFDALRRTVTEREERENREFVLQNDGANEEEIQKDLLLFKAPWISDPWHVYECSKCKKFFKRKRIRMICDKGEFEEKYVECPTCGDPDAAPINEDDFYPKNPGNDSVSICNVECPKCNENLTVTGWGIWD